MHASVVVPTCHRNDLLAKCRDCLAPGKQEDGDLGEAEPETNNLSRRRFNYEVIVTDDGSRSTSREMLDSHYSWARWVQGPRKGPAANRNSGARMALGKWVAFVDDDCLPDEHWLKSIWDATYSANLDVIEGKTITPDKVDSPFLQGVENLDGGVYWRCNLAVRREMFCEMGGFDEDFLEAGGEDMEFAFRIRKNHLRAYFEPAALVLHPARQLGWKQIIRRTRLNRWILLYRIKTGEALPPGAPLPKVLWHLFTSQTMFLLRNTFQSIVRPDTSQWRTQWFFQAWNWLTFPVMFPYLVKWELRFRKDHCSPQSNSR